MNQSKCAAHKLNNNGLSLVELIVVVMILGILSTTAVISISTIARANVSACTSKLSTLLDKTRIDTISKEEVVLLNLYFEDKTYYAMISVNGTESEPVELGSDALTITLTSNAVTDIDLKSATKAAPVKISFYKGSGAYRSYGSLSGTDLYYESIKVQGSKSETIVLVRDTGRNFIE